MRTKRQCQSGFPAALGWMYRDWRCLYGNCAEL